MSASSGIQYLCNRELHPDTLPDLSRDSGFGYALARHLPNLLRERTLDLGETDKVFASQWLSEDEVIVGTKCNRLVVVDTREDRRVDIPLLRTKQTVANDNSCGIHCMCIPRDSRRFLATGGYDPNNVALYRLPDFDPLTLGVAHTDWLFDMQWMTDSLLLTGSRDSTMALWSTTSLEDSSNSYLAEEVPTMAPIFKFSNVSAETTEALALAGERVRSLAYNNWNYELASLQTNPCGASVYFWDAYVFQQTSKKSMPHSAENVCLEVDRENSQLYAVGSRSHVTFIDSRLDCKTTNSIKSLDSDCGVRSLQFHKHLLSIGTGAGRLFFYDIRARKFLDKEAGCECHRPHARMGHCSLKASPGWLRRDHTYRDFFSGLPEPPNALYTHCYSPLETKIFIAGGPLPLGLCGNYAAVWL